MPVYLDRLERIAEHGAVRVLAVDPCRCAVPMLVRRAVQPGLETVLPFLIEQVLPFDQDVRHLARTDADPDGGQKVLDLWFAQPRRVVQREDPCGTSRAKLSCIPLRTSSDVRLPRAGGVELFL